MNEAAENGSSLWPIIAFTIYWAYLVVTYEQRKRNGLKTFFDFGPSSHGTGAKHNLTSDWLTGLIDKFNDLDEDSFLAGAVKMYEFILANYAAGNRIELVGFLAPDVFDEFSKSIEGREANGETLAIDLISLTSARIVARDIGDTVSELTVRFEADLLITTRHGDSTRAALDTQEPLAAIDIWTFQRRNNALNKTWILVATETE
ncbi:Tim44/TimA family putative adaptor protein [Hoeflea sp. YIM 152468]|uniref:Tim44/TimA family putative adaptor protein n=1 Tax=Hoeflea sp. YIM 152468 TaxID=3031759 RepID=UPI0023DA555D|nr:Tim44/TimA family putative adaptor protein [Hoeflea sp. YIM 152468]MDF1609925.1 Tim44/TimA family putative adaptor protein [Hoeflea sp. YIM 152468]